MKYVVKTRELKWAGKTLLRGEPIDPKSDRDHKHIELLVKIGKAEKAPARQPVREVVSTRALKAEEPVAATAPVEPMTTEDAPAIATKRAYHRRDMKAEG